MEGEESRTSRSSISGSGVGIKAAGVRWGWGRVVECRWQMMKMMMMMMLGDDDGKRIVIHRLEGKLK